MSDGHRTGRSTGRVSCKSTELKRCSMAEMRWNKYEVSLASHVLVLILLLVELLIERAVSIPMCRLSGMLTRRRCVAVGDDVAAVTSSRHRSDDVTTTPDVITTSDVSSRDQVMCAPYRG